MGRWDALKPEENKDGGRSSSSAKSPTLRQSQRANNSSSANPRSNAQIGDSSPSYQSWKPGKQKGWNPATRTPTTPGKRILATQDPTTCWATSLSNQVHYFRSHSELFEPTKVQTTLEEIRLSSMAVRESVSLLVLVDLLEIDQEIIQAAAWNLIDERLKDSSKVPAMEKEEAKGCVEKLARYLGLKTGGHSSQSIRCLGRLVSSQADQLPAEETAQKVVGPILLPALETLPCGDEFMQICVFDSMNKLLSNSQFASAILSPLVQDVSTDGTTQTVTNPIRKDLFRSLQTLLFSESNSNLLRAHACSTLAATIETLRTTDETSSTAPATPSDLDQPALEQFLWTNLDHTLPLYRPSLLLLRAVLRIYPKSVTKLASRLLFPDRSKNGSQQDRQCPRCSCRPIEFSSFLASVHNSLGVNALGGLALDCTAELIGVLPLDRWLKLQPHGRNPVSGFYRKVVDSLSQTVSIARCAALQKQGMAWEESSVGRLCTRLFVAIPWDDESLEKAGENLWSTLATSFQDPQTPPSSHGAIAAALISSMGGCVTPQGDLPPMALPARRWLSRDKSGVPFVQSILSDIRSTEKSAESSHSLDLLCAMLRTRPETLLPLWEDFENLIRDLSQGDSKERGYCLCIMEAFLLGRKDFPSDQMNGLEEAHAISELAFSLLESAKDDSNAKNRCRALNSYAALVQADWEYLGLVDDGRLMTQVEVLLQCCTDPKADVRRAACKAVGEFSSEYLTGKTLSGPWQKTITETIVQICETMSKLVKEDTNAGARSMAIFALGNLALAINEHDATELLAVETVVDLSNSINTAMSDSNDKVAGNAIRSIGHWSGILARLKGSRQSDSRLSRSLLGVLDGLTERVARAVALASKEKQSSMSWKERSTAKKHGWGACHSLGRVFGSITVLSESSIEQSLFRGVEQLIQCLKQAPLLSEKVILAAMAALRALKPLQLVGVTGKSGLVGDALVCCCLLLFTEEQNSRFAEEGSLLLSHLLSCASISDVTGVLKQEDFSKSILESLYRWMVEHEMEGRTFEIFALGLQRPGLSVAASDNVSLEQHFASRALWQYKKEQSLTLSSDDQEEDDGGDEL